MKKLLRPLLITLVILIAVPLLLFFGTAISAFSYLEKHPDCREVKMDIPLTGLLVQVKNDSYLSKEELIKNQAKNGPILLSATIIGILLMIFYMGKGFNSAGKKIGAIETECQSYCRATEKLPSDHF